VIPSWYQRAGYVTAMADLITTELDKFEEPQSAELFFSAHGVPKSYVEEAGACMCMCVCMSGGVCGARLVHAW